MTILLICAAAIGMTALYGWCFTWVITLHWQHREYLAATLMAGMAAMFAVALWFAYAAGGAA